VPTISNSSPLILYARIGRLELIHQLVGELVVPTAVYDEIVVAGAGRPGAAAVSAASWIQTRPVRHRDVVDQLLEQVDPGEAEAIALGVESSGRVVILIDDRRGRRLADERNFQVVGSRACSSWQSSKLSYRW
jgi:predicted nucleic acid-binding protein